MQNERMEAGANFVPSLREYAARWGDHARAAAARPEGDAPGPDEPRRRDRPARRRLAPTSLIETQVRSGLVMRMAVLYDVLTGGPVGVQALAAAEVA